MLPLHAYQTYIGWEAPIFGENQPPGKEGVQGYGQKVSAEARIGQPGRYVLLNDLPLGAVGSIPAAPAVVCRDGRLGAVRSRELDGLPQYGIGAESLITCMKGCLLVYSLAMQQRLTGAGENLIKRQRARLTTCPLLFIS